MRPISYLPMFRTDGTTGSGILNVAPRPGADTASMRPSCALTTLRTMARPEARALRLGREERTEDALEVVGADARPVVAHLDDDLRRQRIGRAGRLVLARHELDVNLDVALAAERLEGVGQQVREQLPQLVRVGQQFRDVRRDARCESTPRRGASCPRPA